MSNKLIFRKHALQRMFERSIGTDDVRAVLTDGKSIIAYTLMTRPIPVG